MNIDIDYVRSRFPGLKDDFVLFDNAGGSQITQPVLDRMNHYLVNYNVQLGASYQVSEKASECMDQVHEAVRTFINAKSVSEVVMGPSTSMLLRILAGSFSQILKPGDEIVVTNFDHEANISPWRELEKKGVVIREWRLSPDKIELDLEDLSCLLNEKTRLVAVTHASNILGTINPIKEIANIVHQSGALICVDGVAYAPHRAIDVQNLDVDFYAFSFYKVYGPHHAVLYGKEDLLAKLPGWNHYFIEESDFPYKFQPGNVNYELSYGCLGICDYLADLADNHSLVNSGAELREKIEAAFDLISVHEGELNKQLLDFLNSKSRVSIIGSSNSSQDKRVPTISFIVDQMDSQQITLKTDQKQIGIRFGDFYAKRLIEDLGLAAGNGVVRASLVHYNTHSEIDRLIKVLDQLF